MNNKASSTSVHIGVGDSEGDYLSWAKDWQKRAEHLVSTAPYGMRVRVTIEVFSD